LTSLLDRTRAAPETEAKTSKVMAESARTLDLADSFQRGTAKPNPYPSTARGREPPKAKPDKKGRDLGELGGGRELDVQLAGLFEDPRVVIERKVRTQMKDALPGLLAQHGGSEQRMFQHYDTNGDGGLAPRELKSVLHDAEVDVAVPSGLVAGAMVDKGDTTGDGLLDIDELRVLNAEPIP